MYFFAIAEFPPPPPPHHDLPGHTGVGQSPVSPASLRLRFGAIAIDLVLAAVSIVGLFTLMVNGITNFFNYVGTSMDPYNYERESTIDLGGFRVVVVVVAIAWVFSSLLLWQQSTTPGKKIFGLHTVDSRTGRAIGFRRMFVREAIAKGVICLFLSGIPLGVGLIMILVHPKRRAYWDLIASTTVVERA